MFLDFDGVLHPEGEAHIQDGGADFCFLPRLEALLREFPEVKIVISSSWREQVRYETLVKPFSSDIRARILGATPHSGFGLPPPYRKREGEILAWLQLHDAIDEAWVALDDAYWQFDRCKEHLVRCGSFTGFDDLVSTALRARFEQASRQEEGGEERRRQDALRKGAIG
jgi:hypothetical protein